ncbi:MAG: hypothetical protein QNJ38_01255 [Prochloraceae cyanobacterium]|nr:hypothetical protein [Prochloraceae cyanobacterium]
MKLDEKKIQRLIKSFPTEFKRILADSELGKIVSYKSDFLICCLRSFQDCLESKSLKKSGEEIQNFIETIKRVQDFQSKSNLQVSIPEHLETSNELEDFLYFLANDSKISSYSHLQKAIISFLKIEAKQLPLNGTVGYKPYFTLAVKIAGNLLLNCDRSQWQIEEIEQSLPENYISTDLVFIRDLIQGIKIVNNSESKTITSDIMPSVFRAGDSTSVKNQ